MLTQSDIERERYESRLKAQRDRDSGLNEARMSGKIEVIRLCERVLKRAETPSEHLAALLLEDLTRIADELQAQALAQR